MRRELRVWSLVDVEYLTTHILSLLKAIDIRSEPAIRLLSDLLDTPNGPKYPHGAEHFAHELYSFLRSPFKELWKYDELIQVNEDRVNSTSRDKLTSVMTLQYDPIPQLSSPVASSSWSLSRSISRSPSFSRSPSPVPRSPRSRSRSHSRPPRSPRDPFRRDTFVPHQPKSAKRWNERDTWIDPDYSAWLEEEDRRQEERIAMRRSRRRSTMDVQERDRALRGWSGVAEAAPPVQKVELLPSPPPPPLRMDENATSAEPVPIAEEGEGEANGLSIRGAAAAPRKTLLERLAAAKAEAASKVHGASATDIALVIDTKADPLASTSTNIIPTGVRAAVQARLRLKLKLASEKKAYVFNQNESRAQALRAKILEARARREATETDEQLRYMDRLDRAREIRRRLMVAKMMAAETESEKRARELKEKLLGERKAKMLKEMLKDRKKSQGEGVIAPAISVR